MKLEQGQKHGDSSGQATQTADKIDTANSTSLSTSVSPSLRTLRAESVKSDITSYIEQLPNTAMNQAAKKMAQTYLNSMTVKSPEEGSRALSAIREVNSITETYAHLAQEAKTKSHGRKFNSSILSATGLIRIVADLDLSGAEVRAVAEIAIAQERNVSRVGNLIKEFAASRTAQDRDIVFKSLPPEKRAEVLTEVEALTKHIRGLESSLPSGEKISLTTIEALLELTGSIDIALELVDQLVEFPMGGSCFSYMFRKNTHFHNRYDSILRYVVEKMTESPSGMFDMEAFLSSNDRDASSAVESFMDDPREETEAYDSIMKEDEFWKGY